MQRAIRLPYNFILRHASPKVKKYFWDKEFASGKWHFIDNTTNDFSYCYLRNYCHSGRILDLGCGPGSTAIELSDDTFSEYVGVDISEVALNKAKRRAQERGLERKLHFANCDMLTFAPPGKFDVILLRESVYHVPTGRLRDLLMRYSAFLTASGVFIVKLLGADRYTSKARVRIVESSFEIVEKGKRAQDGSTVLVFRPRAQVAC